ncbi:hypothetical protein FACS1894122_01330 [Alphaproteobacteria bacterium]|nr:hypothetical protein FACS1894122_01330 [Alphaproteobacteria bacterium]
MKLSVFRERKLFCGVPREGTMKKDEIGKFIDFYNFKRLHQNLDYKTPNDVYNSGCRVGSFVYAELSKLGSLNLPPVV